MAKRRQSKKQRAASLRNLAKARRARGGGKRRGARIVVHRVKTGKKGHRRASRSRVTVTARRNGPAMGGWVNLPTMKEGLSIVGAAVALPFITKQVSNLVPVATLQGDGYGNIALEFGIGALASGVAHKFKMPRLAEAILVLSTAKAGYRIVKKTLPQLGLSEDVISGDESVGAYVDRSPDMGAYIDRSPEMGAGLPAVTIGADDMGAEDVAF